MFDAIIKPIGAFFLWMYNTIAFHSYGLTIIYFTVLVQLLLIPLTIRRTKSTLLLQKINPELQHIQKKYGNDRQRLQEEQQKLYERIGYNPMSGCFPLLIQLPVIMLLWQVIGNPLQYVFNWSAAALTEACTIIEGAVEGLTLNTSTAYYQISIMLHKDVLPADFFTRNGVTDKLFNMDFLGVNLGMTPKWNPSEVFGPEWKIYVPLLIVAILSAVISFFMNRISMKINQPDQGDQKNPASGCMAVYMPLISLWFAFRFPVGMSIYWITSNVCSTMLSILILRIMKNREEQKAAAAVVETVQEGDISKDIESATDAEFSEIADDAKTDQEEKK